MKNLFYLIVILMSIGACKSVKDLSNNPPMQGFDIQNSDAEAIRIADEVMDAMGGRNAWEATRYLAWDFFGSRKHIWDKHTGDVRIESKRDNYKLIMNIHTMKGKVWKDGAMVTHPDSLAKFLDKGKSAWINDSYWLVMPYKLKDSGVTLKYIGDDKTVENTDADVLELTFKKVGKTPHNKYLVFVDKKTRLVTQWTFFTNATDEEPRFATPWTGYEKHGNIMLSGGRGTYELKDIEVLNEVPQNTFKEL